VTAFLARAAVPTDCLKAFPEIFFKLGISSLIKFLIFNLSKVSLEVAPLIASKSPLIYFNKSLDN
jgi:hypothetical protein